MRDDDVRSSCFASLDVLSAQFGDDVPYRGGLYGGFAFRGRRIPFLSYMKGIHRASAQQGPAALSINTSADSPYEDEPPRLAMLHAKEVPSSKGGTMFADMRAAYDALSGEMKQRLATMVGLQRRPT